MTPKEKLDKIEKIIDKYNEIFKKAIIGGKVDPLIAKKLKIPKELKPIVDLAAKYGMIEAKNRNIKDLEKEIAKLDNINLAKLDLSNYQMKEDIEYLSSKCKTYLTRTSLEQLKREYGVLETVFDGKNIPKNKMANELRRITKDRKQDWDMVIRTELNNRKQEATAYEILNNNSILSDEGGDTLVYKQPNPDACIHCKRLYLKEDGITPKVFKLSEMVAYGSNVGLKVTEWKPTLGVVHPHCQCQLKVLPKGMEFDENGNLKKVNKSWK